MFEKYIVVFVTASSKDQAEKISGSLINKKLAACVNIVEEVSSVFFWDNKIDTAKECLLVIKTKKSLFCKLKREVKLLHSYDTPEIIAIPIICGDKKYLDWINESCRQPV